MHWKHVSSTWSCSALRLSAQTYVKSSWLHKSRHHAETIKTLETDNTYSRSALEFVASPAGLSLLLCATTLYCNHDTHSRAAFWRWQRAKWTTIKEWTKDPLGVGGGPQVGVLPPRAVTKSRRLPLSGEWQRTPRRFSGANGTFSCAHRVIHPRNSAAAATAPAHAHTHRDTRTHAAPRRMEWSPWLRQPTAQSRRCAQHGFSRQMSNIRHPLRSCRIGLSHLL